MAMSYCLTFLPGFSWLVWVGACLVVVRILQALRSTAGRSRVLGVRSPGLKSQANVSEDAVGLFGGGRISDGDPHDVAVANRDQ